MWPFGNKSRDRDSKTGKQAKAIDVLEHAARQHVPLVVELADRPNTTFNSYLLRCTPNRPTHALVLDEWLPKQINAQIHSGTQFHARFSLRGVTYQFQTEITDARTESGAAIFRARLPKSIQEDQNRSAYRVAVLKLEEVPVVLMSNGRATLHGKLGDISTTGLNILVEGRIHPPVTKGDIFEHCAIQPQHDDDIRCQILAKHVEFDTVQGVTQLGCKFHQFERFGEKALEKLVARLQRKERRNSVSTRGLT